MDKYTLRAVGQLTGVAAVVVVVSFVTAAILNYFQPTVEQTVFAVAMIILGYTGYNLVKIQADILRSRDNLKK